MYVIRRTDQGGGYVARSPVQGASYTPRLQDARVFSSREAAEVERCLGNEVVVSVDEIMRGVVRS